MVLGVANYWSRMKQTSMLQQFEVMKSAESFNERVI